MQGSWLISSTSLARVPKLVGDDFPALFRLLQELENKALESWYVNVLACYPNTEARTWLAATQPCGTSSGEEALRRMIIGSFVPGDTGPANLEGSSTTVNGLRSTSAKMPWSYAHLCSILATAPRPLGNTAAISNRGLSRFEFSKTQNDALAGNLPFPDSGNVGYETALILTPHRWMLDERDFIRTAVVVSVEHARGIPETRYIWRVSVFENSQNMK